MASGTGERPLGTPAQEKALLSLSGWNVVTHEISTGSAYIHIPRNSSAMRTGLIIFVGGYAGSSGVYAYGRRTPSTAGIVIDAIKAPTRSGVSLTVSGDYVKLTTDVYQVIRVIHFSGGAPTCSNTAPT